jgi:hypothetical protein
LQVVPNKPIPFGSDAVAPLSCDFRFPAAAVLPEQGLWFIEWLQRRIHASNPGQSTVYAGLNDVCTQLDALTDVLKCHGISFPCRCIPLKLFLKLEGEMSLSSGDWLDCTERHVFLRNEVMQAPERPEVFENSYQIPLIDFYLSELAAVLSFF